MDGNFFCDTLFDNSRLVVYSDRRRRTLLDDLSGIVHDMSLLQGNLDSLVGASDIVSVIGFAKDSARLLERLVPTYYRLLGIWFETGQLSREEFESLRRNREGYVGMYGHCCCLLDDVYVSNLVSVINSHSYVPSLGSEEYCRCKGYYDLSRVEMGRLIKSELGELFPDSVFSVKTEWSNWGRRDVVTVRIVRSGGVDRSLVVSFLEEFKPRVIIQVK